MTQCVFDAACCLESIKQGLNVSGLGGGGFQSCREQSHSIDGASSKYHLGRLQSCSLVQRHAPGQVEQLDGLGIGRLGVADLCDGTFLKNSEVGRCFGPARLGFCNGALVAIKQRQVEHQPQ